MSGPEAGQKAFDLARERRRKEGKQMDTILAHSGVRQFINAPLSPPIHMASTYTREPDGEYKGGKSIYNRIDNPTRVLLEEEIAVMETHGKETKDPAVACAFASGLSAASNIVLAHKAPVTILLAEDCYHGLKVLMHDVLSRFQVHTKHIDLREPSNLTQALGNIPQDHDVIVWMETPSNPHCHVIDIANICQVVRKSGRKVTTVVDSTMAPPPVQQPLLHGADLSMHSATKYMGGHSDVLCGVVTVSPWTDRGRELGPRLRETQIFMGSVASAMDSWLTLRGCRTLGVRVRQQCQSALAIATFLEAHPHVKKVHYPGLESHGTHSIAKRQMNNGYGGVLSFELESQPLAMAVVGAVQICQRATSLGGTETLIEHRASIEPEGRRVSAPGLLRLSVGLEDTDDLICDLERAISTAVEVVHGEDAT